MIQLTRDRKPTGPLTAPALGAMLGATFGAMALTAPALLTATASATGTALHAAGATIGEDGEDVLVIRRGSSWQEVRGKILSESDDEIVFEVVNLGLRARTVYKMDDVIEIRRGSGDAGSGVVEAASRASAFGAPRTEITRDDPNTTSVYTIHLDGDFAYDITPTPVRDAVQAAKKHNPDVLLVVIENDWGRGTLAERSEQIFDAEFQRIFQAEEMMPVFIDEIETEWPRDRQPRVVMWVKEAMGGAAFIPWFFPEIYFHPQGRMGGLGNLLFLYGTTGDSVVREKLFAANLTTVQGMAIRGGYDELLVTAMSRIDQEVVADFIGGEPHFFLGEAVGEQIQVTDNGLDPSKQDSAIQRIRGEGNDVLTLKADSALRFNVSRGTAATFPELWRAMGIDRTVKVIDDADGDSFTDEAVRIMDGWSSGVRNAERTLRQLVEDYDEIVVQGNRNARNAARGRQVENLNQQRRILNTYGEAWPRQQFPVNPGPALENIQYQLDLIELQRIGDRAP